MAGTARSGGWFRRVLFVVLLLAIIAGIVVSAILLRQRFDAVLGEVDSLTARLEQTQTELEQTQLALEQTQLDLERTGSDLTDTKQALGDLAREAAAARAALQQELTYQLLVQRAQTEAAKAILSLTLDDVGQARREITALRATLVRAGELASDDDAPTLADLETRASRAEADLNVNAFAAQQTLEVIWRELNALGVALLGG